MKKTILIIVLLATGITVVRSQQLFNYDSLSIFRVLQFGLETNFDIRLKKQIVGESQGQLTSTKGAFNPQLSLNTYGFYGTDPTVTFMNSYYLTGQLLVPTRLGIKLYTGFKLSTMTQIISGVPDFYPSTNMPINASGMWAGITMPLLRDLGRHNTNNTAFLSTLMMNKAQNISFTDEICQFIKNTLTYYYNVYHRARILTILKEANVDAKDYVSDVEAMIADEQIAQAEIYRARAYEYNINQQYSEARNQVTKLII